MCGKVTCFVGEANEQESRIPISLQGSEQMSDIWKWACVCFIVLPRFKCKLRFCPPRQVLRLLDYCFAASCFLLLAPQILHFWLDRQVEKLSKVGKKAIHTSLMLWRGWRLCSPWLRWERMLVFISGTDLQAVVWETVGPRRPGCNLPEQSHFSIFTISILKGYFLVPRLKIQSAQATPPFYTDLFLTVGKGSSFPSTLLRSPLFCSPVRMNFCNYK